MLPESSRIKQISQPSSCFNFCSSGEEGGKWSEGTTAEIEQTAETEHVSDRLACDECMPIVCVCERDLCEVVADLIPLRDGTELLHEHILTSVLGHRLLLLRLLLRRISLLLGLRLILLLRIRHGCEWGERMRREREKGCRSRNAEALAGVRNSAAN